MKVMKKDRSLRPIPAAIADALMWLDDGEVMTEREFMEEAKRAIRAVIQRGEVNWSDFGVVEEYDSRVWKLIDEVLMEN